LKRQWLLMGVLLIFISTGHLAALIASAVAADDIPRISVQDLKAKMDRGEDITIIDVRSADDFERSKVKIKGAIRISIVKLADKSAELPRDKEIITYCT
jgi:hypothetical protein